MGSGDVSAPLHYRCASVDMTGVDWAVRNLLKQEILIHRGFCCLHDNGLQCACRVRAWVWGMSPLRYTIALQMGGAAAISPQNILVRTAHHLLKVAVTFLRSPLVFYSRFVIAILSFSSEKKLSLQAFG